MRSGKSGVPGLISFSGPFPGPEPGAGARHRAQGAPGGVRRRAGGDTAERNGAGPAGTPRSAVADGGGVAETSLGRRGNHGPSG
jgi:hypothetical protein